MPRGRTWTEEEERVVREECNRLAPISLTSLAQRIGARIDRPPGQVADFIRRRGIFALTRGGRVHRFARR